MMITQFYLRMLLDMDKLFKPNVIILLMPGEKGSTMTGTKKSFELLLYNLA